MLVDEKDSRTGVQRSKMCLIFHPVPSQIATKKTGNTLFRSENLDWKTLLGYEVVGKILG
jgi:hypothetical protein